jgi:hypothetical protein
MEETYLDRESEMKAIRSEFNGSWNKVVNEMASDPRFSHLESVMDWFKDVLQENVTQGKQNR